MVVNQQTAHNGSRILVFVTMNSKLADNELQSLASTTNCIYRNAFIQRGEFAFIADSQSQEINICDLGMRNYRFSFKDFQDTQVLRPKMVTCCFAKLAQD